MTIIKLRECNSRPAQCLAVDYDDMYQLEYVSIKTRKVSWVQIPSVWLVMQRDSPGFIVS